MGTQEFKDDALPSKKELHRVESPFDFNFESPNSLQKHINGGQRNSTLKVQEARQHPYELNLSEELKVENNNLDSTEPLKIQFASKDKNISDRDI